MCDDGCCPQIARGYIIDTGEHRNLNVPIYQTAGVSDVDAIATTTKIKNGYNGLSDANKNDFYDASNFNRIEIVPGLGYSFDPIKGIVEMGVDWAWDFVTIFFIIIPELTPKV